MIAILVAASLAAEPAADTRPAPNPFADAMITELRRDLTDLRLAEAPPIYHLRFQAVLLTQTDLRASFGQIVHERRDPYNALGVEVRVGDAHYDNTGFGGWQDGFGMVYLPERLTPEALRLDAWRLVDRSYKQAVEQYSRKKAQFTAPPEYPGDYVLTGAVSFDGGTGGGDATALPALAKSLSQALAVNASLTTAEVWIGQEQGARIVVDSESTDVRAPMEECTVRAVVQARADDGEILTDHRLWTVRRPEQLPAADAMAADGKAMAEHLVALTHAPPLGDEYVGPVLFEDDAALDVFRWLLVPQLEGTPAEVPFDSWFGSLGGGTPDGSVRLERRVLPSGWTVIDDPAARADHPASFTHDNEGTPTQRVELVTDGIVRTVLMSRVPRKEIAASNGHARGAMGERASGRAAVMTVTPAKQLSTKALRKRALKAAAAYGRDWVFVVRRLQDPAIRGLGGNYPSGEEALPPPVSIVRLYADGREEELRGAAFAGVQRFALRDVLGAGELIEGSFMAVPDDSSPYSLGATTGLATFLSAPSVLIGELELVPAPGDPRDKPVVPPPPLGP